MQKSKTDTDTRSFWRELASFRQLWPFLRDQKPLLLLALLLIPLVALLQMAGPMVVKQTVDNGIIKGNNSQITSGALLFLIIVVARYLTRSGQNLAAGVAIQRMIKKLRMRLSGHLLDLPASFHDKNMSGALVTRATSDFDSLGQSLNTGILGSVVDLVALLGSFVGLLILQWQLGVLMLLILPLISLVVMGFTKALKRALLKARAKISSLNAFTQEALAGAKTIKTLTAEKGAVSRYKSLNYGYRDAQMKSVILDSFLYAVVDGLSSVILGVVLWVALSEMGGVKGLTAGILIALVAYMQQIFHPLKELSNKIALLQGAFTAMDRIFGLLLVKDKIAGRRKPKNIKGLIRYDKVSFTYTVQGKDRPSVLNGVSFSIKPGQSTALVGATGSGKTTIIKLLLKLYDGYRGNIFIDGIDLKQINGDTLRQEIAVVPQDIALFDGSINFNIGLGNKDVTEEMIKTAAVQVGADIFIRKLPGGYNFHLKEQGGNLSQGQRQLLTFARALARQPKLVVLDEATSSIDPESEALIQKATEKLLKERTVIVIAHRLSTIQSCKKILVMDKGKIVESGSHKKLLSKKGVYAKMYNNPDG